MGRLNQHGKKGVYPDVLAVSNVDSAKFQNRFCRTVKIGDLQGGGAIYQFVRLGKGCLFYLIATGGEAAVVDAARMIDVSRRFADGHGLIIKYALDTHLHADHISGGKALAEASNGMYDLPPKDDEQVGFAYQPSVEGVDISVGQTKIVIRPLYSPGHTIGSTSLIVDGKYC